MPSDALYEGPITMTRKGFGFFPIADDKEDLLIPPQWTNHALAGDIVKVAPAGSYRDPASRMPAREAGKVVAIVKRARETFVGTLTEENGLTLLAPDYKKMYVPLVIRDKGAAAIGDKVLARLGEWAADKEYPLGHYRGDYRQGRHARDRDACARPRPGILAGVPSGRRKGRGVSQGARCKNAGG